MIRLHLRPFPCCLATLLVLALPRLLGAQPPTRPPFVDEQKITAVDAMVEVLGRKGRSKGPAGPLPTYLGSRDFEVVYDGEAREVIDVGAFGPAQFAPDTELWTFVIYFDRPLSNPSDASWAAGELAQAASRLTDLGTVEVVVADPEPKSILAPTRDTELLASVLAEIALFPEGNDHQVLTLRDEYLAEIARTDSEIDPGELAAFAATEERLVAARQLDSLLTRIAETGGGARRGLFWVSQGFDLRPGDFYRSHGGRSKRTPEETVDLTALVEALGRTLGAYGWATFALVTPPEEAPARGLRIGKWRLGPPRGSTRETSLDPLSPHDTVGPVMLDLLSLKRLGDRDLGKADAYLEFGETLAAQDDLPEAEQALRMALYHLDDDPGEVERQVRALVALGEVLDRQGRRREARAAFVYARRLDEESPRVAELPLGELAAPLEPLERIARETSGTVVRDREALLEVLGGLGYRVRVTYQVSGAPDGELHPVEIRCKRRGCELAAPSWARSGTPREVAASRIRRWIADDQFEEDFRLDARAVAGEHRLELETDLPAGSGAAPPVLRVTLGFGDPETLGSFVYEQPVPVLVPDTSVWILSVDLSEHLPEEEGTVSVLVEDLESGRWGAAVVE